MSKFVTDDRLSSIRYMYSTALALRECISFKKHVFMNHLMDYGIESC